MIGISPDVFWTMTPWQFHLCIGASIEKYRQEHEHSVWLIWHSEALARTKKLPPLKDLLKTVEDDKKEVPKVDEAAIIGRFKAYNDRLSKGQK